MNFRNLFKPKPLPIPTYTQPPDMELELSRRKMWLREEVQNDHRKAHQFIQIRSLPESTLKPPALIALSANGSLWLMDLNTEQWRELPKLPTPPIPEHLL